MKKVSMRSLSPLLFCFFCAMSDVEAQTPDSLSKSQMFEMTLSETNYKITADLLQYTKILYDTLGYDSLVQTYYPNGQLYKQYNYLNGLLHGKALIFHSNGRLQNEKHYYFGECTDSQCIYYDMFGFVELESWIIHYKKRDFLCISDYGFYGKLSAVRIYDCLDPQVVYAGFMLVDGKWKPRNHHYPNARDAKRVLKHYQKEYAKRHLKDETTVQQ